MVFATQTAEIRRVGSAAVFPVNDVMHVQTDTSTASGNDTAAVTVLDQPAGPVRYQPLRTTGRQRRTVHFPHRPHVTVTGHETTQHVRQDRPQMGPQHRSPVRVLFQMRVHQEPVRRRRSRTPVREIRANDVHQRVHLGQPRHRTIPTGLRAPVRQQLGACRFQRGIHQHRLIGRQRRRQTTEPVLGEPPTTTTTLLPPRPGIHPARGSPRTAADSSERSAYERRTRGASTDRGRRGVSALTSQRAFVRGSGSRPLR